MIVRLFIFMMAMICFNNSYASNINESGDNKRSSTNEYSLNNYNEGTQLSLFDSYLLEKNATNHFFLDDKYENKKDDLRVELFDEGKDYKNSHHHHIDIVQAPVPLPPTILMMLSGLSFLVIT